MDKDLKCVRKKVWISPRTEEYLKRYKKAFGWSLNDFILNIHRFIDKKKLFESYSRRKLIEGVNKGEINPLIALDFQQKIKGYTNSKDQELNNNGGEKDG